jgi:hypothetical protein
MKMNWDFFETYGALLSAVLGGLGIKVIDKMLTRRSETFVESARIREEIRQENLTLRHNNKELEDEVDAWKLRYYEVIEHNLHIHPTSGSL